MSLPSKLLLFDLHGLRETRREYNQAYDVFFKIYLKY